MDPRSPQTDRLEELSRQLELSRSQLGHAAIRLRHRLDVPQRVRSSVRRNPGGWFAGSLAVGLVASLAGRRRRHRLAGPAPHRRWSLSGLLAAVVSLLWAMIRRWTLHRFASRF